MPEHYYSFFPMSNYFCLKIIKELILFGVQRSMNFDTCIDLCNHHHHQDTEHYYSFSDSFVKVFHMRVKKHF